MSAGLSLYLQHVILFSGGDGHFGAVLQALFHDFRSEHAFLVLICVEHGPCALLAGKGGKNRSRAKSDRNEKRELHFKNTDEGQGEENIY
jgi:hypothetical protein